MDGARVLFLSDFHLGIPNYEESRIREQKIIDLIEFHLPNLEHLYLVGDLFDFWFEYKHVVPKGFLRLLGALTKVSDKGIPISIFKGNHDIWMWDYFEQELDATIYTNSLDVAHFGHSLHIHHGDGLGPGDKGYKFIKKIFHSPFFQWIFKWLHPDIGVGIANYMSQKSSAKNRDKDHHFLGIENEWLIDYCKDTLSNKHYDYLIFGHRHLPIQCNFTQHNATYYNLGDWLKHESYGLLTKKGFELISLNTPPIVCQVD
jgi:UDP-2,3-diacylglucosamine hydrolase